MELLAQFQAFNSAVANGFTIVSIVIYLIYRFFFKGGSN